MVRRAAPTSVHFHCARGFYTHTLAQMLDSLVRVSRRVADGHYASILAGRVPRLGRGYWATGYNTPGGATFPGPLSPRPGRCWPADGRVHRRERRMIRRGRVWPRALPFQQFHVLFNSLFKVLFIFRSLYLCAIGLRPVFSLRRNLPPILSSIPKLLDSSKEPHAGSASGRTGLSPSTAPRSRGLGRRFARGVLCRLQLGPEGQTSNLGCCRFTRRYWGNPCWFLFLRLLICLSSAGGPTRFEVKVSSSRRREGVWPGATAGRPQRGRVVSLLRSGLRGARQCSLGPARPGADARGPDSGAQRARPRAEACSMTLERACPPECRRAQCAFKDSMTR